MDFKYGNEGGGCKGLIKNFMIVSNKIFFRRGKIKEEVKKVKKMVEILSVRAIFIFFFRL